MNITLSREQEALIRQAIDSGRLGRAEDALVEAMLLWEERERLRAEFIATLDEADAAAERGEEIHVTREGTQALVDDIVRRGRERLAAGKQRLP